MPTEYFGNQLMGIVLTSAGAYAISSGSNEIEETFGDYSGLMLIVGLGLIGIVYMYPDQLPLPDDLVLALGIIMITFGIEGI